MSAEVYGYLALSARALATAAASDWLTVGARDDSDRPPVPAVAHAASAHAAVMQAVAIERE